MQAWHFLSEDKRLGYDDGRSVEVGVPLECEGEPELCRHGMHGSVRIIDALHYASGPIVCRVEIEGDVIQGYDKLCGRRRTVLWWLDATRILHEFACKSTEDALALIANPDHRSMAGIEAKRKWLAGEITDDELASASVAAWDAARSASVAAWDASEAARSAALAAAWSASAAAWSASVAAWDASEAARSAALAAAWSASAAAWSASDDAWDASEAARSAALAAAREKQDARLTEMVMEAHEKECE